MSKSPDDMSSGEFRPGDLHPYLDNTVITGGEKISNLRVSSDNFGISLGETFSQRTDFGNSQRNEFENLRLSKISPKDKPWDKHKNGSLILEDAMSHDDERMQRRAERLSVCSEELEFLKRKAVDGDGEERLVLQHSQFCRVRGCPICAWRRSLKWTAKMLEAYPELLERNPRLVPLMLTLTVPNCQVHELRATIQEMNRAWHALIKRKKFSVVLGWLRNTEVTRGQDGSSCHPHFHILILVDDSYFRHGYISHQDWHDLWHSVLKLEQPDRLQVDIRRIKPCTSDPEINGRKIPKKGLLEVTKYATKVKDIRQDPGWFVATLKQLDRLRFIASGGILKDVLKDEKTEDDDLVHINENADEVEVKTEVQTFKFVRAKKKGYYYRTRREVIQEIKLVSDHVARVTTENGEVKEVSLHDVRWSWIDNCRALRQKF